MKIPSKKEAFKATNQGKKNRWKKAMTYCMMVIQSVNHYFPLELQKTAELKRNDST